MKAESLKWLVTQGVLITRVYGYIRRKMENPFKNFMLKVSEERRKSDTDPDYAIIAEMCKLVGNSAFGRTGMKKKNFSKIVYGDEKRCYKEIGSKLFKGAYQYGDYAKLPVIL